MPEQKPAYPASDRCTDCGELDPSHRFDCPTTPQPSPRPTATARRPFGWSAYRMEAHH